MEIIAHTETKLTLRSTQSLGEVLIFVIVVLSIPVTALARPMTETLSETADQIVSLGILGGVSLLIGGLLATLLAVFAPRISTDITRTCTLDKESGFMIVDTKSLWWSRTEKHPLKDIMRVIPMEREGDQHAFFELELESGGALRLAGVKKDIVQNAEVLNTFLGVSLPHTTTPTDFSITSTSAQIAKSPSIAHRIKISLAGGIVLTFLYLVVRGFFLYLSDAKAITELISAGAFIAIAIVLIAICSVVCFIDSKSHQSATRAMAKWTIAGVALGLVGGIRGWLIPQWTGPGLVPSSARYILWTMAWVASDELASAAIPHTLKRHSRERDTG